MPTVSYQAQKESQALTIKFQKNTRIPLHLLSVGLIFSTKIIEHIFANYSSDEKKLKKLLGHVIGKEIDILIKEDKAIDELCFLSKLISKDLETFKKCIPCDSIDNETLKSYANFFSGILLTHLLGQYLKLDSPPTKTSHSAMWNKVTSIDKSEEEKTNIPKKEDTGSNTLDI